MGKRDRDTLEEKLLRSEAFMEVSKDGGPVREIFNGRRHRPVGLYPSIKSNRMIAWESRLERRTIRWLEVETDIVRYIEQPHRLWFPFAGRRTHYTPDFEVMTSDGSFYVEVKYRDYLRKMDRREWSRLKKARYLYRSAGKNLIFVTDLRFRTNAIWHNNAVQVEEARRFMPTADDLSTIVHHLLHEPSSTVQSCAEAIDDLELGPQRIMALMLRRILRIDLEQPIGLKSAVSLCQGFEKQLGSVARRGQPTHA